MKKGVKRILYKNKKLRRMIEMFILLGRAQLVPESGKSKRYPKVLQLPITYMCNSKCVMCNIPNMNSDNEITPEELEEILRDPLFKNIRSVGINGGEPFLKKDIERYVEKVLLLPKIKSLNIITNGLLTPIILKKTKNIYKMCKERNVSFHISVSLDGVEDIHDKVRGVPGAFEKTIKTINELCKNKNEYCDSVDIGCTISKHNIDYMIQLEKYADLKGYEIKFRLAIPNKRIDSISKLGEFSVFYDFRKKQAAKEFFQRQVFKAKNIVDKYKYWSIFMFLSEKKPKRYLGCNWKENGITLDSKGNIYYCAVESNSLGNVRGRQIGQTIFFSKENLRYRNSIINNKCDQCIHDYSGKPELKHVMKFVLFLLRERFWVNKHKGA